MTRSLAQLSAASRRAEAAWRGPEDLEIGSDERTNDGRTVRTTLTDSVDFDCGFSSDAESDAAHGGHDDDHDGNQTWHCLEQVRAAYSGCRGHDLFLRRI